MSDWTFLNQRRIKTGPYASTPEDGFNGAFWINLPGESKMILCIASDGMGWQHVSVSFGGGVEDTPSWEVMCQIKDLFWEPEDVVVQYHPAKSQYINCHPGCLHLWRPTTEPLPVPNPLMVGSPT